MLCIIKNDVSTPRQWGEQGNVPVLITGGIWRRGARRFIWEIEGAASPDKVRISITKAGGEKYYKDVFLNELRPKAVQDTDD